MNIESKLKKVKLLAMDFDGVLTDGFVYVDQESRESVRCSRKDSLGIAMLKKAGIKVGVISKETNPVVTVRCKKLNIPGWQGVKDARGKLEIVKKIANDFRLSLEEIAYIGDDLTDIEVLAKIGVGIAVADAHPKVKKIAHYITKASGGNHAVREVCEIILLTKGINLKF